MARTATNTQGKPYASSTKERVEDELRERRYEEYGGFKIGAAFFGWLVASGLSALLTSIVAAAGTAIALSQIETVGEAVERATDPIGILGGILLLLIAGLAYYAGGYVAGRLARFDGVRQGLGVWVLSVLALVLAAVAGAVFGAKYNLLQQINLPHIPVDAGDVTAGGIITLLLILAVTLGAAILGGKAGERYHRKVDQTGI